MNDASLQQLTAMRAFAEFNVEALYLRPTRTGLDKSIMDAHKEVRNGLKDMGIHDYSSQGQGRKEKVKYPVRMLHADWEERRFVSLYRPQTKAGACGWGLWPGPLAGACGWASQSISNTSDP